MKVKYIGNHYSQFNGLTFEVSIHEDEDEGTYFIYNDGEDDRCFLPFEVEQTEG